MSCAAFAPHCWNETSRAEPEYVIDRTLPSALCAFAMTVLASCAIAIPARDDAQSAASASFFTICYFPLPSSLGIQNEARFYMRDKPSTRRGEGCRRRTGSAPVPYVGRFRRLETVIAGRTT